jgi:hypothetical protein
MNLYSCFSRWRPARATRAPRRTVPDWVNASGEPSAEALDEVLLGCGWFDSSHALHRGLQVTEHPTPERVVDQVPLGWWLDWQSAATPAPAAPSGLCPAPADEDAE